MRIASLALAFSCICFVATSQGQKVTLTGKLIRSMAIGGESTGWAIEFGFETAIDGKRVSSIQVEPTRPDSFKGFENKWVEAVGSLSRRQGVETGERLILSVSSIREVKGTATFNLLRTEWLLEDLGGSGVIDNVQATLAFPDAGKVAGHASCNRFFGSAEIKGSAIKLSQLGATRMACPEAVMNQEAKYLKALEGVSRFEWKAPHLLLYSSVTEKPLRFTRK